MPLQPVTEPVVSVVMIFLNGEKYIREAIESIVDQPRARGVCETSRKPL